MGLWTWIATHEGIVGTLLGTTLGAALGFVTTYASQRLQRLERQSIGRMRIATDLRYWLDRVQLDISEVASYADENGGGGKVSSVVPAFRFEDALDVVSSLDGQTSKKIFDLIHRKDRTNAMVEGAIEYLGYMEALDQFRGEAARLWLDGVRIYDVLCDRIGWPNDAFGDKDEKYMRQEVERLDQIQRKALNATDDWLFAPEPRTVQ